MYIVLPTKGLAVRVRPYVGHPYTVVIRVSYISSTDAIIEFSTVGILQNQRDILAILVPVPVVILRAG